MLDTIYGKKVLFISPKFFNYEVEIVKEMEQMGALVDHFDERPQNTPLIKALLRLKLKIFLTKQISKHYREIIKNIRHDYDYVLIIAPETITADIFIQIKKLNPKAKTIVYMWDSIKNKNVDHKIINLVDRFITFDPDDFKINNSIEFIPLFYIEDYKNLSKKTTGYKYDYSFVGTAHSDRYSVVSQIKELLPSSLSGFLFYYSPSRILFCLQKMFISSFRTCHISDISFNPLKKDDVLEIVENSMVLIDIEHPQQKGLTMRTIEMIGAKRKIITTNNSIMSYDFYNENNILLIERSNIHINTEFFNTPYVELEQEIYDSYALKNWLKKILC